MSSKRYPEEFKIEAVKQVTERRHAVADVANRIGVSQHSLYEWLKRYSLPIPSADHAEALLLPERIDAGTGCMQSALWRQRWLRRQQLPALPFRHLNTVKLEATSIAPVRDEICRNREVVRSVT